MVCMLAGLRPAKIKFIGVTDARRFKNHTAHPQLTPTPTILKMGLSGVSHVAISVLDQFDLPLLAVPSMPSVQLDITCRMSKSSTNVELLSIGKPVNF